MAVKRKVSKPDSKEYNALKRSINTYFKLCDEENEKGGAKLIKPYTVAGLCCHIGISRDELQTLENDPRYSALIVNAKLRVESFIEENTLAGRIAITGAMYSLKYNFNWTDKEKDGKPGDITVNFGDSEEDSK